MKIYNYVFNYRGTYNPFTWEWTISGSDELLINGTQSTKRVDVVLDSRAESIIKRRALKKEKEYGWHIRTLEHDLAVVKFIYTAENEQKGCPDYEESGMVMVLSTKQLSDEDLSMAIKPGYDRTR